MIGKCRPESGDGNRWRLAVVALLLLVVSPAQASLFAGETLDAVANGVAWVAIIVGPIVAIVIFWLVHILPEKIAEKRRHPQTQAIQTLCLLSLFFGGLLWPIAWLWAYSKPVLYKLAYGTDVVESHHGETSEAPAATASTETALGEIDQLKAQLAALEARLGPEARS